MEYKLNIRLDNTVMLKTDKLYALAADIEDVLLRFRGTEADCETLRDVVEQILEAAGPSEDETHA